MTGLVAWEKSSFDFRFGFSALVVEMIQPPRIVSAFLPFCQRNCQRISARGLFSRRSLPLQTDSYSARLVSPRPWVSLFARVSLVGPASILPPPRQVSPPVRCSGLPVASRREGDSLGLGYISSRRTAGPFSGTVLAGSSPARRPSLEGPVASGRIVACRCFCSSDDLHFPRFPFLGLFLSLWPRKPKKNPTNTYRKMGKWGLTPHFPQ